MKILLAINVFSIVFNRFHVNKQWTVGTSVDFFAVEVNNYRMSFVPEKLKII